MSTPLQDAIANPPPTCKTGAAALVAARLHATDPETLSLIATLANIPPPPPNRSQRPTWLPDPKGLGGLPQGTPRPRVDAMYLGNCSPAPPPNADFSLISLYAAFYDPALACYYNAVYETWVADKFYYNLGVQVVQSQALNILLPAAQDAKWYTTMVLDTTPSSVDAAEVKTPCNRDGASSSSYVGPATGFTLPTRMTGSDVSIKTFPRGAIIASTAEGRNTCAQILPIPFWNSSGTGVLGGETTTGQAAVTLLPGFPVTDPIPFNNTDSYVIFEYGVLYSPNGGPPVPVPPVPNTVFTNPPPPKFTQFFTTFAIPSVARVYVANDGSTSHRYRFLSLPGSRNTTGF